MKMPRTLFSSFLFFAAIALAFLGAEPRGVRAAKFDRRFANLSTRAQVGSGASVLIMGFVVLNASGASIADLTPGNSTIQVRGTGGATGAALL